MMTDDHRYIIRMPGKLRAPSIPKYGVGHDIFHKMKGRLDDIAEYIVETDGSVTIGERLDAYIRVAINLKKHNIASDDIVAICARSHEQTTMPYIGALFNGNIVTCVDPFLVNQEKAIILRKVTPKILFVDEEFLEGIEDTLKLLDFNIKIVVIGKKTNGHISFEEFLRATQEEIEAFEPKKLENNDSTALIVFSSGTTGTPKGICVSHTGVLKHTSGYSVPVTFSPTSPVWISYGLLLIRSLREGGALVLSKNFEVSQIWNIISKYKVYLTSLSVYHLHQIVDQPRSDDIDISSLFVLVVSGAAISPALYSKLRKKMPKVNIIEAYGLTETCGVTLVFDLAKAEHREFFKRKPHSCGAPIPGFHYKIVDPETEQILGPNKPGELRVKPNFPVLGYYKEDSSDIFDSDGYFKTGDILKYDEDKCFYFVDRLKEVFKFRGYKWSPTALMSILLTHPSVEMAVVIGIPNDQDGHRPMGIVKLRTNCKAEPEELAEYVNKSVDANKRIWDVKILDDMPVTASGKINKRILRDMIVTNQTS